MKHAFLSRRHRNPHQHDDKQQKEQPFFSKSRDTASDSFFNAASRGEPVQTKLAIGQPGDTYENEADAVADHVVSGENQTTAQRQGIGLIQRAELTSPREEEKPSTAEARMEKDKLVQRTPEAQIQAAGGMEEKKEKSVQMQATSTSAAEEKKEKPVQTQPASTGAAEEKKEKPVRMQRAPAQPNEEKEKKIQSKAASNSPRLQRKPASGEATASPHLSNRIQDSSGKGKPLPGKTRAEMENAIDRDFSSVNIHTDPDAAQMNEELGAHAFTHGSDIYFNTGKYHPESQDGKRLLAHELTHVVQQTGTNQIRPCRPKKAPNFGADERSRKKMHKIFSFDGSTKVRDALFAMGDFETAEKHDDSTLSQLAIKLNGDRLPETGAVIEGNTYYFHVVATQPKQKKISRIKLIRK